MEKVSFTQQTKIELCKAENKKSCCERAEVYALLLFLKYFSSKDKLPLENAAVARRLAEKVVVITGCIPELVMNLSKKGYIFSLIGKSSKKFVVSFFEQNNPSEISFKNIQKDCCVKAFIRGLFLACGHISDPQKQYKIEFVLSDEVLADNTLNFINQLGILNLKLNKRKETFVLYTKSSSQIEDFLTYIGAANASMEIMQTKMYKEAMNNINRKANFETANMDKTFSASARQMAAIVKLMDENLLDELAVDLSEIAYTRINNPEMSLSEMAKILNVSRSSVNHRLNKIVKFAENINEEKENI